MSLLTQFMSTLTKMSTSRHRRRTSAAAVPPTEGKRARNKDVIRRKIVAAALTLFQTKGFETTTTRAIARKAGIAEGTVFNYFRTKEDIALHFFELEVDRAIATVRDTPRLRKAPLDEQLFALVESQLDYLASHERFIGAAFLEALKPTSALGVFNHRAQALRLRYIAFVQELFEASAPKKRSHALDWIGPQAFWVFYLGVLLFWLQDTSPRKANTIALLDRSLSIGASLFGQVRR